MEQQTTPPSRSHCGCALKLTEIKWQDLHADLRRVVHLKGSGSGLPDKVPEQLAQALTQNDVDIVAWDGDSIKAGSFTTALLQVLGCKPLVAFLWDFSRERFLDSWSKYLPPAGVGAGSQLEIKYVVLPFDQAKHGASKWIALGREALRTTGSHWVLCWGGGATCLQEFKIRDPQVGWTVFSTDDTRAQWQDLQGAANLTKL